jgi:hypothetical protein
LLAALIRVLVDCTELVRFLWDISESPDRLFERFKAVDFKSEAKYLVNALAKLFDVKLPEEVMEALRLAVTKGNRGEMVKLVTTLVLRDQEISSAVNEIVNKVISAEK